MNGHTREVHEVIVLGAGASGLAVAKALQDQGMKPVVLEQGERVGESWYHRHPQLNLNTHRSLSSLPGLPFPDSVGAFPSRLELIDYLHRYVETFHIDVRTNAKVSAIVRDSQRWELVTNTTRYLADHVVVATGFDQVPYIPEWAGLDSYTGICRHSAQFGDVGEYVNKKVLVVGGGNSGVDILNHLSRINTGKLWLSIRQGSVIIPSRVGGVPIQPVASVLEKLPVGMADTLLSLTERLCFGDLQRYGVPKVRGGAASRLQQEGISPAIDNGFVKALKTGKVSILPGVHHFSDSSVVFEDGEEIAPDVILFATGYRTNLKSLLGAYEVLDGKGEPRFHGAEQDPSFPGLWFTGMRIRLSGFFVAAGDTGAQIANAISKLQRQQSVPLPASDIP